MNNFKNRYRNLTEMLSLYADLDEQIERKTKENKVKPFCSKRCCLCCDEYFYVSKLEYFVIKHYLLSNGCELDSLIQRSKQQCRELHDIHPDEFDSLLNEQTDPFGCGDDRNIKSFMSCIFLKDKKCSIYPVRPIICRLYGISYSYAYCDKILQKLMKVYDNIDKYTKVLLSRMIDMPYHEGLRFGIDYVNAESEGGVTFRHASKPLPLFWWFAHDREYSDDYEMYTKK
jgi:Fe-S-cluster containining protein